MNDRVFSVLPARCCAGGAVGRTWSATWDSNLDFSVQDFVSLLARAWSAGCVFAQQLRLLWKYRALCEVPLCPSTAIPERCHRCEQWMVKAWAVVFAPWQGKGCQLSSWFSEGLGSSWGAEVPAGGITSLLELRHRWRTRGAADAESGPGLLCHSSIQARIHSPGGNYPFKLGEQ